MTEKLKNMLKSAKNSVKANKQKYLTITGVCAIVVALVIAAIVLGSGNKTISSITVYSDGDYISQDLIDDFTEQTGIKVNYIVGNRTLETDTQTVFEDTSTQTADEAVQEALQNALDTATASASTSASATDDTNNPYSGMSIPEVLQYTRDLSVQHAQENAENNAENNAASSSAASSGATEIAYEPSAYDVVLTDSDTLNDLVSGNYLMQLKAASIPNTNNIDDEFMYPNYDPASKYTITTMWEYMGLLENNNVITEHVNTWGVLWDSQYTGRIIMPNNDRDCLAVSLLSLAQDPNTADATVITQALDHLVEQKPLVSDYNNLTAFILMENNLMGFYPCYSGDALNMMSENLSLSYVIPQGGTYRITFGYAIPADTGDSESAMAFVNYMCSTTSLAKNAEYSKYSSTSRLSKDKMAEYWLSNPVVYPNTDVIGTIQNLYALAPENQAILDAYWSQITAE